MIDAATGRMIGMVQHALSPSAPRLLSYMQMPIACPELRGIFRASNRMLLHNPIPDL
jgi:hypothetical protein